MDNLLPCILGFRLHLDSYGYINKHVPGKELHVYTADTLSQAPVSNPTMENDATLKELAEICILEPSHTYVPAGPSSTSEIL